ncbi:hypothetical protein [Carboxylicivirga caseinilyticus]|uniref:hypothetical protein n=1 Tax=Carboxylicivirga caseinilyticus TaxID=3417572 RepID=UPI003D34ABEC|nr:hypothetical protein [Marinilabiliaceae bacterium A049]
MKPEIHRSLVILIAVSSLFQLNISCEKEEWKEIDLSETACNFEGTVINSVTNYSGYIHNVEGTAAWVIIGTNPENTIDVFFLPCNLASDFRTEGLEIIFDGEVMNVVDYLEGELQKDFIGTPFRLTYARVKIR